LGHRDKATVDRQTTQFLIDPLGLWSATAEYSADGSLIAHNTFGLGLTSRVEPGGAAAYYDFDAMGNTAGLTDSTGAYVNRYQYLPFGETTVVSAAVPNPFTFSGQFGVMSDASNLSYMRYRNYDPTTGQFLSDDPNGIDSGDTNLRRYVLNSPTTTVDPFGLEGNGGATSGKFEITICPVILPERRAWLYKDPGWQGAPYKMSDGLIKEETKVGNDWFKTPLAPTLDVNGQPYVPQPPEMVPNPFPYGDPGNCISGGRPGCNCGCPPGTPPGFPPAPGPGGSTRPRGSFDPNEITGPAGFGDEKFIQPEGTWPYTVRFENDPLQATAPAQEVFVTHQLDGDLDWNTFALGDFGFGSQTLDVPDGVQSYETRVEYQNQDGTPLLVDVDASLDRQTGIVSWTFRSVDPDTGALPDDVFAGFLPVNDASGRGEGFVTYLIQPKNNLATGVTVDQQASIVFDTNTPVITNTFTNTIDAGLPSSSVEVLSPITTSAAFTVSWSGDDDAGGSGIASFDVFVSENDGPYTLFQDGTTGTSAQFTGTAGRTYRFYSVATDNVGHVESAPQEPDAQTTIDIPISPQLAVSAIQGPVVAVPGQLRSYFVTFTDAAAVGDHTAAIDWGDGTVEDAFVAETTNGGATTGAVSFWHTYTGFGDFEPKLTVRDSQNHQTVIDGFITVQTITLQPDPLDTAKTALLVGGLATVNDLILFEPEPNTTRVRLYYNGSDMGAFSFNGSIGAYGQTGNDLIQVSPVLAVPALLYGQEGNDILVGGAANDILVGSTGNDILYGSGGRDLLFGGLGSDYLQGSGFSGLSVGDDSDVLVADYSVIDYDVALLDRVYDRWSDNSPYANRVAGLRTAPLPVGLNDMSVLNDFAIDRLFGGSDSDWLHYRLGMDFASDLQAGEDVN
jgi:RHS repeat-associated protein